MELVLSKSKDCGSSPLKRESSMLIFERFGPTWPALHEAAATVSLSADVSNVELVEVRFMSSFVNEAREVLHGG